MTSGWFSDIRTLAGWFRRSVTNFNTWGRKQQATSVPSIKLFATVVGHDQQWTKCWWPSRITAASLFYWSEYYFIVESMCSYSHVGMKLSIMPHHQYWRFLQISSNMQYTNPKLLVTELCHLQFSSHDDSLPGLISGKLPQLHLSSWTDLWPLGDEAEQTHGQCVTC